MTPPKVFFVGSTGYLGRSLLPTLEIHANQNEILLKLGVRENSNKPTNTQAEIITLDFDDVNQLASQFMGSDVIISTLNWTPANFDNHNNIALAASKAGVKNYIPSEFGNDARTTKYDYIVFDLKANHRKFADSLGLKVVSVYTSPFLEFAVNNIIDIKDGNSEWNIIGHSSDSLSLTSLVDLSHVLVRIAIALNEYPEKVPSDFRICSDTRSYDNYASTVKKILGRNIKINTESISAAEKRYNDGIKDATDEFFTALKLVASEHGFDFSEDNLNDFIDPNEKYFKWTKFDHYIEASYA